MLPWVAALPGKEDAAAELPGALALLAAAAARLPPGDARCRARPRRCVQEEAKE